MLKRFCKGGFLVLDLVGENKMNALLLILLSLFLIDMLD